MKWFLIKIPSFAVNEKTKMVAGEMKIEFETREGQQKMMEEAFLQKWEAGKIIYQGSIIKKY